MSLVALACPPGGGGRGGRALPVAVNLLAGSLPAACAWPQVPSPVRCWAGRSGAFPDLVLIPALALALLVSAIRLARHD